VDKTQGDVAAVLNYAKIMKAYGSLWWHMGVCGGIWEFVVAYGSLWWHMGVCGGILH